MAEGIVLVVVASVVVVVPVINVDRIVSVGVGRRMPDHAAYDVFQIL